MNISVGCRSRSGASEPARLCLGRSCLPVSSVLRCAEQSEGNLYEVRVLDGRRFVVRRQVDVDRWELVAVYDRRAEPRTPSRAGPALTLLLLIGFALAGKAARIIRRWRSHAHHDLPKGGAPA